MECYTVGQRVKLTAPMTNHNSTWKPVEDGVPVGLEGTITYVNLNGPREFHQISVRWDNGRGLALMPYHDKFQVLPPKEPAHASV